MRTEAMTLGGLSCQVVDALSDQPPDLGLVMCHGYGAPPTDLVALAFELLEGRPHLRQHLVSVFPAAPIPLDAIGLLGGRAWWHVDVAELSAAIEQGELRRMHEQMPPELLESRKLLLELVEDLQRRWQLPADRLVLGGFSQGAILATDVALRLPQPPAGLCIFSGTLVAEDQWRELAGRVGSRLRVLQSHGRQDPILPFDGAVWLRDLLRQAGVQVDFLDFAGGHTIPLAALTHLGRMLEGCLSP